MANQDYLTIGGTNISLGAWDVALDRCTPYTRGGISELEFSRIVGVLAALPDPWSGLSCSWSNGSSYPGTTYFSGTIVGYTDRYDSELGWVRDYRALGLENLGTYVPVTDSNTLSDSVQFNMPSNAINSLPSRMGRTCGQAVLDVLSMPENAAALQGYGIGNYTSTGSGATASATMTVGNTLATYGTVSGLVLGAGGSGYGTTPPSVTIVGPCTTQAVYTANLTAGSVSSFTQVSAGRLHKPACRDHLDPAVGHDHGSRGAHRDPAVRHDVLRGTTASVCGIDHPELSPQSLALGRSHRQHSRLRSAVDHQLHDHVRQAGIGWSGTRRDLRQSLDDAATAPRPLGYLQPAHRPR